MNNFSREEHYQSLFSMMDEGYCVIEMLFDAAGKPDDYRFIEVNPAFERHTGLVAATGRRVREFTPTHEQHWFDAFGHVALTGEALRFENEARALGRWFDVNAFPFGPRESRQVAVLFTDISRRKKAEAEREALHSALAYERSRLADIIEQAPAFICVLRGPNHVFELANERYYEIVGRRNIVGRPVREAMPEVDGQGFFELLDQVYRTGETFSGHEMSVLLRRNQVGPLEQRYMNLVYQAIRENDGTISGVFVHGVDVTETVAGRKALEGSERQYRLMVENVRDFAVFMTDARGRVSRWNVGAERLMGWSEKEIIGQPAAVIFTPEDRQKGDSDRELETARRTGHAANERWHVRKDGSRFYGSGMMMRVKDETGAMVGFTKVMRNETERKLAEEAVRQARDAAEAASHAKDRFLAVLSHELRTPLTPVALVSMAMELDPRLPYEFREDVSMIRRNVELETRLIDDLLDVSRVTSGKLRLNRQPSHVHMIIRHVLETVGAELHEKQLEGTTELGAQHDIVQADTARLQQVLWNLLKNAGKFTPAGGRIVVRTRDDAGRVVIEVEDTGQGITGDLLPHIFEPFAQGGEEITRRHGGMGLGLAIAKAIVDLHGGTITAASQGEGMGATFTVVLSIDHAPATTSGVAAIQNRHANTRPLHVLLVEDHADTARTLSRLLRLEGLDVRHAESVAAALEMAAAEKFNILISDIGLPDGSGYELMRKLREKQAIVGIAMSGYGMDEDIRKSMTAGFAEHFVKPLDLIQIRTAIARLTSDLPT